jgi:hypothetical protein
MASSINALTAAGGGIAMGADASGILQLQSAGTATVTVDTSGNVGIGTSSPASKLEVSSSASNAIRSRSTSNNPTFELFADGYATAQFSIDRSSGVQLLGTGAIPMVFSTNSVERARIDSSGNLLVGATSFTPNDGLLRVAGVVGVSAAAQFFMAGTGTNFNVVLSNGNGQVGTISTAGSNTAYNTSSDYRLKNTIAPMTGALAKVALLKPCTYKWNSDGSDGQGFIAHELQEVVEGCVTGEKDAVDAEGKPQYQGIDTSFLVATLTAAIQEQQALITQLQADVATLKGLSA